MGLAASQARFLAITARKADCEYQSMKIAQNKLSITRELASVTEQYQDALNATKLVWDYDGSGDTTYDLSYSVLMTPTILNGFNPYLITTRTGSVVLNTAMANAASVISPSGAPADRSASGFAEFMNALAANGVLAQSTANAITALTNTTYTDASGNVYTNPTQDVINSNSLTLESAGLYDKNAGYGSTPLSKNEATAVNVIGLAYQLSDITLADLADFSNSSFTIYVDGTEVSDPSSLTLGDVLTSEIYVVSKEGDNSNTLKNTVIDSFLANAYEKLLELLGTDIVSKQALNSAYYLTQSQYKNNTETLTRHRSWMGKNVFDSTEEFKSDKSAKEAINNNVSDYNYFVKAPRKNSDDYIGVSLSNMLGYLLTLYELSYNGYDSDYSVASTSSESYFVTDDPYYNYVIKDSNSVDNDTLLKADFYMQLYNNICVNGWTASEGDIEDSDYLEQMLKNGNYFITALSDDGYFYQGRYNNTDCIVEVKDEDAIAMAEVEYTTQKAKLTYKEEQLDLDMQNLDAEISSLTTEYDTVKNLISKNVEKVFSMFQ